MDELMFKEQDQSQDKSTHPFSASTSSTTFSDLSIPEDDTLTASSSMSSFSNTSNQGNIIQHGGFVPGYDPWAAKNDKSSTGGMSDASSEQDIQNQRRKSESVLHDLSASKLDYLTTRSIHQQSDSLNASAGSSILPHLTSQSVSPTNSGSSSGPSLPGRLSSSRSSGIHSGSALYELHPLSPIENRESGITGTDTKTSGHHLNSMQPALHPHFETALTSEAGSNQLSEGDPREMCGLCGVQPAVVPLGTCGHRVCNVCHRHEKHRSLRLFQNASPPCPFCTHGVITAQQSLSLGKPTVPSTDRAKQGRQYSFPNAPQQSYAGQQAPQDPHQQRLQRQKQTFTSRGPYDSNNSDDINDGYPLNRYYHQTFPIYGAAHATALLRTNSLQLDNASPTATSNPVGSGLNNNTGNYTGASGPTDHLIQNSSNASHQKPPPGYFSIQPSTLGGQNVQRQNHPYKQGLNQYAPNFQPGGISTAQQYLSSSDMAVMGRPGMVSPPTGAWREGGSGMVDYTSQEYAYQQQPSMPPQYLQQRRGSQQHSMLPPMASNAPQGYLFYGHAMGNLASPGLTPHAPSTTLSFPILPDLPPAVPPTRPRAEAIQWAVVRVTNIPWDVSLQDMLGFFTGLPYPPEHLLAQNIHILMDRTSGKTFNSAFVELALTTRQAGMVAQARNQRVLKGRQVSVELSSQDELLRSVFPKWIGDFANGEPLIPGERAIDQGMAERIEKDSQSVASWHLDSTKQTHPTPPFVTRDEINALLVICRNYKLHFSRKCAERPFENILSILAKYPWHQSHRVLPLHRDHIFELLKLSIESLRMHLSKEYNTIHPTLLTRMVRCAVLTPAFTERQKNMVLVVAGVACPEDIVGWMAPPAPVEAASALLGSPNSEMDVDTEDAGKESEYPCDSSTNPSKSVDPSLAKSIEDSIEGLAISKPSGDSINTGDPAAETFSEAILQQPSFTDSKEEKSGMAATTWAAVVAPSAKAPGQTGAGSKESTPTETPEPSSSTLAPSYASAVVQTVNGDVTPKASAQAFQHLYGNLALNSNELGSPSSPTSLGSLMAHSGSSAWKPLGSHNRHSSSRSLSISGISTFASSNTQFVPAGVTPYSSSSLAPTSVAESPVSSIRSAFLMSSEADGEGVHSTSLTTSARHHRGSSLPKLAIPQGAGETTCSSTASSVSSLVATPFNISPVSTPAVTGEKSASESILNAIKTITQSTPRLTKVGSATQMPMSAPATRMNGTASMIGQTSGNISGLGLGHKQQRREGGETL
ncbi:hypothetical protein EC991_000561 [Linnemannia zychae]|nr:hypothetical protein EC991_000561 [Linnemannia zychae]